MHVTSITEWLSKLGSEKWALHLRAQTALFATMPGTSFGNQADGFIRLSLTVPDEILQEACQRIARFCLRTLNTQIQTAGE
jgi:aspartate/methionine/tyrosine aminotransferase